MKSADQYALRTQMQNSLANISKLNPAIHKKDNTHEKLDLAPEYKVDLTFEKYSV